MWFYMRAAFYWMLIIVGFCVMIPLVFVMAIPFLIILAAICVFMLPFILMGL